MRDRHRADHRRADAKVVARLWERWRIIATPIVHAEYEGARITPNVYTTLEEIDTFAGAMEEICTRGVGGSARSSQTLDPSRDRGTRLSMSLPISPVSRPRRRLSSVPFFFRISVTFPASPTATICSFARVPVLLRGGLRLRGGHGADLRRIRVPVVRRQPVAASSAT